MLLIQCNNLNVCEAKSGIDYFFIVDCEETIAGRWRTGLTGR